MSRSYCSYDEEWQRRKSVLIKSLFHDIPILSPVEEESSDSSQDYYAPRQEAFPSPPRPYSPLPPLIIERVPVINKHDEPEEYYRKLHKKIKRIYLKLFIEKRNVSSVDYDSNYSQSLVNDDNNLSNNDDSDSVENLDFRFLESISPSNRNFDSITEDRVADNGHFNSIIEDREARLSSASTKSNGYGADFESMDTAIIDVTKYTTSNEDVVMISEEEESDSEPFDNESFHFTKSIESRTSIKERADDRSLSYKQNVRHSTIEDQEMTESGESNVTEVDQEEERAKYEEEESNNEIIDEYEISEKSHNGEADRGRSDSEISGREESHPSRINKQVRADSQVSRQSVNVTNSDSDSRGSKPMPRGGKTTASEDGDELMEPNVEPMEGDVGTSSSSEGQDYRQITIEALVHFDGTKDGEDRESRIYEDSVKSVILPTRFKRVVSHNVDERIEVYAVLEEKDDPKTTAVFSTDEDQITDLEEVTTPQPDTAEKEDENMITSEDDVDEDTGAMQSSTTETTDQDIEAPEEDVEKSRNYQTNVTEKNLEEIEAYHQTDATKAENQNYQKDTFEKKIEAMRTLQQTFTEKYLEDIKTHKSVPTEKEIGRIRTPPPSTIEKDFERTRVTTPETIEEMRTAHLEVADLDMRRCDSESNMEEDEEETDEEMKSLNPIEIMRAPRPALSHGTIPETHKSESGSSFEHTALPQEAAEMTSSFQDGVDNNVSELQTSNDMNEVLTSIFNKSRSKGETPTSGRKRKLVDKSVQAVQTRRVTWDEMRSNFFVATPKIFRLCACTDHVCY